MSRGTSTMDNSTEKGIMIAAKLRGPGPAKYKLPGATGYKDHDGTKKKMPSFSFGKRFSVNVNLYIFNFILFFISKLYYFVHARELFIIFLSLLFES